MAARWLVLICAGCSLPRGVVAGETTPDEGLPLVVPPSNGTSALGDEGSAVEPEPTANVGCVGAPSAAALRRGTRAMCCYTPPSVFQKRVMLRREAFAACYDEARVRNPELRGRVAARFTIEEDGGVVGACDAGSTLADPAAVRCVLRAFTTVTFEAYAIDDPCPPVTIVYPIVFEPG